MSRTVGSYGSPLKYFAAAADSSSSRAMWPCVSACTWVCTSIAIRLSRSSCRVMSDPPGADGGPSCLLRGTPPDRARRTADVDMSASGATEKTRCRHGRPPPDDGVRAPLRLGRGGEGHRGDLAGDLQRCAGRRHDL